MGTHVLIRQNLVIWLLLILTLKCPFAAPFLDLAKMSSVSTPHYEPEEAEDSLRDERLHVFKVNYYYVQIPCEVTLWILLASLAKIGK